MTTTTNIVQQQENPAVQAYKFGLIDKAQALIEKPITLPAPTAVGADPMTLQAQGLAQAGVGAFQPFITSGSNFLTGAGQRADLAGTLGTQVAQNYVPAQQEAMQGTALGAQMGQQAATAGMQGIQNQLAANNPYLQGAVGGVNQAATDAQNQALYAQGIIGQAGQFGMDSASAGQAGLFGSAAQYDPNSAQAYMNPYETQVIDQTMADMQRASDIARQGDSARAVGAGAFGGSRSGIVDSERGRNLLDQQAKMAGGLRAQGYGQALQQSMAAQESALQRQQKAAGLMGQLGQAGAASGLQAGQTTGQLGQQASQQALQAGQIGGQLGAQYGQMGLAGQEASAKLGLMGADMTGQSAAQMGNLALQRAQLGQNQVGQTLDQANTLGQLGQASAGLGQLGQQMAMTDVDALTKLGAQQQVLDQGAADQAQQYELQQVYQPYQKLGFYSDILQGAPSTSMSVSKNTAPSASMLNQVVGAGISGLGIANAAQNVGII
tara:strand:+ start:249 stop:1730 length:1482 start_codon:yes stop_codon:yes gene_type:complete